MDAERETLFHYTDVDGYNAIRSQPVWVFRAQQPPGNHPPGAYFTTLGPATAKLARRLGLPKSKVQFVFCFTGSADLLPLRGDRGEFIVYSPTDYLVEPPRQVDFGPTAEVEVRLQ